MHAKPDERLPLILDTAADHDAHRAPARWTDLHLTAIESAPDQHCFLLDFSNPALRHLHSATAPIIRGSSQIDVVSEAIRCAEGLNSALVFPEKIGKVKFLGMLKKGERATITVKKQAIANQTTSNGVDYFVEMAVAENIGAMANPSSAALIMNGAFSVKDASALAFDDRRLLNQEYGSLCRVEGTAEDNAALQGMKASAPANGHLQQIVSLRQLNKANDESVDIGEAIEATVAIDPDFLTQIGPDAFMISAGNLIQTCYQIPKIYMFSRSSLSNAGLEFYARHITDSRFRPVVFSNNSDRHTLSVRLDINRIKFMDDNRYCACTARVADGRGEEIAVINFSFLLERSAD